MNHGKHADSCYFFRDDARAQQTSGDTSLGANEELRRPFSNFVFFLNSHSIDSFIFCWRYIGGHQAVLCVNLN